MEKPLYVYEVLETGEVKKETITDYVQKFSGSGITTVQKFKFASELVADKQKTRRGIRSDQFNHLGYKYLYTFNSNEQEVKENIYKYIKYRLDEAYKTKSTIDSKIARYESIKNGMKEKYFSERKS